MKIRSKPLALVWDFFVIAVASVAYAIGFNCFYKPNAIAFGGMTGVAQILNAIFPWMPIGVTVVVLNIPLFLLGWKLLGGRLLVSSLYAMATTSLAIDLVDVLWRFEAMDPMIAAIFGGVLLGGPLAFIFARGATTGGTDLLARLLKIKFAWLPMGKLLLTVDVTVIICTAIAFRNVQSALYGLVAMFISSKVMDAVLYGMDTAKVAYIISERSDEITRYITHDLDRGATVLHGHGAWSGDEKNVLMVAFKQREIVAIKAAVKEIDPDAFLIVCDAHEVLGEGFRIYSSQDL